MKEKKEKRQRTAVVSLSTFVTITLSVFALLLFFLLYHNFTTILNVDEGKGTSIFEDITMQELGTLLAEKQNSETKIENHSLSHVIFGDTSKELTSGIIEQLGFLKEYYVTASFIEEFQTFEMEDVETIWICKEELTQIELVALLEYANRGTNLVFWGLKEASSWETDELQKLLGITKLSKWKEFEGLQVIDEFFLGGRVQLEELAYQAYEVSLAATCKIYAFNDYEIEGSLITNHSPLLWRNVYQGASVYGVNGDIFVKEEIIPGIVTAIMTQMKETYLYPILNVSSTIIQGFPYTTDVSSEELTRAYCRTSMGLQRDIMFPSLISMSARYELKPTCFGEAIIAPNNQPDETHYMEKEISANGGIVIYQNTPEYTEALSIEENREGFGYAFVASSTKLYQTELEMLFERTSVTARGILYQKIDVSKLLYPKLTDESTLWNSVDKELNSRFARQKLLYSFLNQVTITDAKKRSLLLELIEPNIRYGEDYIDIRIQTNKYGDSRLYHNSHFILFTKRTIADTNNATITKIDGVHYLVEMKADQASITFTDGKEDIK